MEQKSWTKLHKKEDRVILPASFHFLCWHWSVTRVVAVQSLSHIQLCVTHGLQHTRLTCPSLSPGVCSNSCPLSQWCHATTASSVIHFYSRLQSFPAWGSFPMSQFFTFGGQSIGASALASVLPMNVQGLFPLGLTGLILWSNGLLRVFCKIAIQKHQFFGAQLSL